MSKKEYKEIKLAIEGKGLSLKKVIVPEFYLNFLTSQIADLIKQNRDLQRICYGKSTRPDDIYDSLGYAVLDYYCGDKKCQKSI